MWIIQQMGFDYVTRESNSSRVIDILKSNKIKYEQVVYKDGEWILLLPDNTYNNDLNIMELLYKGKFILRGSVLLNEDFRDNSNHILSKDYIDFTMLNDLGLNSEYMLNNPVSQGYIKDLHPISDEFFVRPLYDNKSIKGSVMTEGEFYQLKNYYKNYEKSDKIENTPLMLCEVKDIEEEYRTFIVNGKYVTGSRYILNNKLSLYSFVPKEIELFSNKIAKIVYENSKKSSLPIKENYCLDIAVLKDGSIKAIEFNSIESSGLYDCDVEKLVLGLNKLI